MLCLAARFKETLIRYFHFFVIPDLFFYKSNEINA